MSITRVRIISYLIIATVNDTGKCVNRALSMKQKKIKLISFLTGK